MPKRAISSQGAAVARPSDPSIQATSIISPETALEFIIGTEAAESFDWGQARVFRSLEGARDRFSHLFSRQLLERLAGKGRALRHGVDCRVIEFKSAKRVEHGTAGSHLSSKELQAHFGAGRSVQFFSPQHHVDGVCELLSSLEGRLQCLVGASVYLTPPGSQGLAPHWDDVDVFILQTEVCAKRG
jgi:hypothetical protein